VLVACVGQEQIDQHNINSKTRSVLFSSLFFSEFERVWMCYCLRDLGEASELSRENCTGQNWTLWDVQAWVWELLSVGWRVYRFYVFSFPYDCEQDAGKQAVTALWWSWEGSQVNICHISEGLGCKGVRYHWVR
jgi:hypothetical protein